MEMATRPEFLDLQIEEVKVAPNSPLAGHSVRQSRVRIDLGIVIGGVLRPGGELLYNPNGDTVLESESVLIVLGQRRQLDQLERLASGADVGRDG
jgi:Trk K+ transport system NAD-binding subunit